MYIEKRSKKRATKEAQDESEAEEELIPKKQRKDMHEGDDSDDDVKSIHLGQNDWVTRPGGLIRRHESLNIQRKLVEEGIEFQHARVSGKYFIVRTTDDLSCTRIRWTNYDDRISILRFTKGIQFTRTYFIDDCPFDVTADEIRERIEKKYKRRMAVEVNPIYEEIGGRQIQQGRMVVRLVANKEEELPDLDERKVKITVEDQKIALTMRRTKKRVTAGERDQGRGTQPKQGKETKTRVKNKKLTSIKTTGIKPTNEQPLINDDDDVIITGVTIRGRGSKHQGELTKRGETIQTSNMDPE
ncbi:hypothetical protein SeMB42_g04785 [Synchytrium endobioticum]|uniref:Uncharacterized protein n=1 Tax=Synchytrium endobioticum TaxID=286115 RepID=A0A507C7Q5_9FUNG|nr:hypothetical protein SeLEV6574_g08209 [Synchytrium endobioticum]TPX43275.1 hypothetical protein SeMB42_g04785 [Synchytrium endobioticum]